MASADAHDHHRAYLLWLLARRDYSKAVLLRKLKLRGVAAPEALALLQQLADEGIYQEKNYIRARTRQLLRRGFGPRSVQYKLKSEKISSEDIDIPRAFTELGSSELEELKTQAEKILRRLKRRPPGDPKELKQKLIKGLSQKGHQLTQILEMIKDLDLS